MSAGPNSHPFRTANPTVHRASTVLFRSIAELDETMKAAEAGDRLASVYGTMGTPTTAALETLILEAEGGAGVSLSPSGLSAIALALLAVVRPGDHLLVTDAAYGPIRELCGGLIAQLGVETEFYDPNVGAGIAALIRPNTRAIWVESPGTHTFEIQDLPAIAAAARAANHRVVTLADNTYGSPGLLAPIALGMDISVVALTKYWGGHSDVLMGAIVATAELLPAVRAVARQLGQCVSDDEAYLVIRGVRTVRERLAVHAASGLEIASRLAAHPRVGRVLHPSLPGTPGHELFQRDFTGPNGLFSFELLRSDGTPASRREGEQLIDRIANRGLIGIGYSWGGFQSLVVPCRLTRTVRSWEGGALTRLSVGLEPVDALWADLAAALED